MKILGNEDSIDSDKEDEDSADEDIQDEHKYRRWQGQKDTEDEDIGLDTEDEDAEDEDIDTEDEHAEDENIYTVGRCRWRWIKMSVQKMNS